MILGLCELTIVSREKGRYGTFSLERDTATIIVPNCIHFVAVLGIRRNRCLISDRFLDSAIEQELTSRESREKEKPEQVICNSFPH